MNAPLRTAPSVCPHDCTSTCALEVESSMPARSAASAARGATPTPTARSARRSHATPSAYITPIDSRTRCFATGRRAPGSGSAIGWDEALDRVADAFTESAARHGAETVWPYFYAGTMGLVQRDGIQRLRHAMKYSRWYSTICVTLADTGWIAGVGAKRGVDLREAAQHADLVVIWGGNPVHTQVNVMAHAMAAKKRGATLVVVDPYRTATAEKADLHVAPRPGTDGALACAMMHVLFAEGFADWDYLRRYTDRPDDLAVHLQTRTPEWAAAITGLPVETIVGFARLYGRHRRSFIRCHHGFSRSRNGAANMHAVVCLPAVTGAWQHPGGGALYGHSAIYPLDRTLIEGLDLEDRSVRDLDQSRLGPILTGDAAALKGGPPVTAMLVQNTNPAMVCPDLALVHAGLAREDLFTCVHEQFMTETAAFADVVLPATSFLEHDDFYTASGHTTFQVARKLIEPPGEARENHFVICELAQRLGAEHPGFRMSAWEIMEATLRKSGMWDAQTNYDRGGQDFAPAFESDAFPRRVRHAGPQVPLQPGLEALRRTVAGNAGPARSHGRDRQRHRGKAVPAGGGSGAHLSQFHVHGNAELAEARAPSDGADPPRGLRGPGRGRGRSRHARQPARRGRRARPAPGRPAARRGRRGRHLAESSFRERPGHQRAHQRGSRLAQWRRGIPRHRGVDTQEGLASGARCANPRVDKVPLPFVEE